MVRVHRWLPELRVWSIDRAAAFQAARRKSYAGLIPVTRSIDNKYSVDYNRFIDSRRALMRHYVKQLLVSLGRKLIQLDYVDISRKYATRADELEQLRKNLILTHDLQRQLSLLKHQIETLKLKSDVERARVIQ